MKNFHRVQRRMLMLAEDPQTRTKARFVVFKVCCGELGNRILALTSSFFVALLTGRGLLIGDQTAPLNDTKHLDHDLSHVEIMGFAIF